MFNIDRIIRKNKETFYNYSTEEKDNFIWSRIYKIIGALLLTLLFFDLTKDFLTTILAIYSILIGFSFNVLFYLLSIRKRNEDEKSASIENKLRHKKINKLRDELFYNVSYFSICSIGVILLALLFFLFDSSSSQLFNQTGHLNFLIVFLEKYHSKVSMFTAFCVHIYKLVFYYMLIESMYSFIRTIGRVSFYFEEKIKLENAEDLL